MTEDEPPTREEALAAAENIDGLIHDAFTGVDNASDTARESRENVGDVEAAIEEIERQSKSARDALRHIDPNTTFEELSRAWEVLDGEMGMFLRDVVSHLEAAEDEEPGEHYDTLTIGDTEYEVWLTPIEDEEIPDEVKESVAEAYREGALTEDIADAHDLDVEDTAQIISDYLEAHGPPEDDQGEATGFPTGKN